MDFRELIEKRRSVREYSAGKTIDRAELEEILEEAQMAPSWKNSQTPHAYAVLSPEAVGRVRSSCLPSFNQKSSANACAFVVTTFTKGISGFTADAAANELGDGWGAYDTGLRDAYLILAAANQGIDTLIMGIRDEKALRQELQIPENEQIVSVIALGYREVEPPLRPRKDLGEVVRFF